MNMQTRFLFVPLVALFAAVSVRAENAPEPQPADGPPGPQPNGADDTSPHGAWRKMFGATGSAAGRSMLIEMASRVSGATLESPADLAKADNLPLGPERRLVVSVPVGGIDEFNTRLPGWRMEQVFVLTDEQQKAVSALRDEYRADQKKLEDDIAAQQKLLADKARQLRLTYEQRANDILTGADKEAKAKLDALSRETQAKNTAAAADLNTLIQDPNARDRVMAETRTVHDATAKIVQDARKALLDALPAESRNRADELLKQEDANQPPGPPDWGKRHGGRANPQDKPPEPEKAKGEF